MKEKKYEGKLGFQFKSLDAKELNVNEESRIISGYAAVFNNIDKSRDMLIKGCFAKSIQDRGPESLANDKIILLWHHKMDEPIGRITKLVEDDYGLYFEAEIDNVERGNQAIEQFKSGTLNQFSIGYRYIWEKCEWNDTDEFLMVKEVALFEISPVSVGCNGLTKFTGFKSIEEYENEYEILRKEIDEACKGINIKNQQIVQRLIAKAMTLASSKPDDEVKKDFIDPLTKKEAGISESAKSMFDNITIKNV